MNLILFIIIIILFIKYRKAKIVSLKNIETGHDLGDYPYDLRYSIFTRSEEAFYIELKRQLPENYHVFSKIRIIDFIKPTTRDYSARNKVWAKHVDFLICDYAFRPVLAIEVDGKSHVNNRRQKKSDDFKNGLFDTIGLPLERVVVGSKFDASVKKLIARL